MEKPRKLFSRKSAGLLIFLGIALAVTVVLAVIVSPWASSSPDGLEKVAEEKGFSEAAETREPTWKDSPVPDYAVKGVQNERVATGLSGLIGVLVTIAAAVAVGLLAWGLGRLHSKKKTGGDTREKPIET
jgi:cobalt/nickel transport protein